jgi:lycopene beta-cyclase
MTAAESHLSDKVYDFIITGAGCAGLSLAMHMIESGKFADKKILLIDKDDKKKNDRTWSFWETSSGLFESIVYKRWRRTWVHNTDFSRLLDISPYEYKMIRGIDFYNYCFSIIKQHTNFKVIYGEIKSMSTENSKSVVQVNDDQFIADYTFSSILLEKPITTAKTYYLLQHFKGWVIETPEPAFNENEATLMDFRTGQQYGTAFVYVKPFSTTKALIEYTLFTEKLLQPVQYEEGLREYLKNILNISEYTIEEEEWGVIPMTNFKFPVANGRIINIGTAGGQTKASSGYTFRFIQKHSARLVENLIKRNNPFVALPGSSRKFRFYDSTLLYILQQHKLPGDKIFTQLFKKNKPQQVLRFLDNETSLADEIKIFSSLPIGVFLKAAIKQL